MPAPDLTFAPTDFERFHPDLQRNPEYNAARLEIRQKLDAFGKRLAKKLTAPELAFTSRASLHHPYRFNAYRVESQFVYLSRADKERRKIKSILGVDLGKDLDQNYVHVTLCLEIHHHGLEIALRVHQQAWWDGENLKRQIATEPGRERVAEALRQAVGFGLRIHDHRSHLSCEAIDGNVLREKLAFYKPGDHWLHLEKSIARVDAFVTEPGLEERLVAEFERLIPAYRTIRWTEENNALFS